MSFSGLNDIFAGRTDSKECLSFLLSLKAPENAKAYVIEKHKNRWFDDCYAAKKWAKYPNADVLLPASIKPIYERNLRDKKFVDDLGEKLSFDISRFSELMEGYSVVAEDIKPLMLHYSLIYLLDFFTRTWMKLCQNSSHGLQMPTQPETKDVLNIEVKILNRGIFPRAVDAFYLVNQSSLFSSDEEQGIHYVGNFITGGTTPPRMEKLQYHHIPSRQVSLGTLLVYYKNLTDFKHIYITPANKILTGFIIIFLISSISRYRAKDWFNLRNNRNLINRIELITHNFVSEWIPELLLQKSLE